MSTNIQSIRCRSNDRLIFVQNAEMFDKRNWNQNNTVSLKSLKYQIPISSLCETSVTGRQLIVRRWSVCWCLLSLPSIVPCRRHVNAWKTNYLWEHLMQRIPPFRTCQASIFAVCVSWINVMSNFGHIISRFSLRRCLKTTSSLPVYQLGGIEKEGERLHIS